MLNYQNNYITQVDC